MTDKFSDLTQIQTSKINKDTIYYLNHYVLCTSRKKNLVGKSYETLELLTKEKYSKKYPWKYKINQYGYRGTDWEFEKTSAFFGCSFIFGIGVEYPAAELVQRKLNLTIPNLGIPGGSAINIIKSFIAFSKIHPMQNAIISLPPISRFYKPEYTLNNWQSTNLIPNFHKTKSDRQIFKNWTNDLDIAYTMDYIDWAEDSSKIHNIKIYWTSWDSDTYDILNQCKMNNLFKWPTIVRDARDESHPGQSTHNNFAKICLDILS